jgi:hypothetical protein
LIKLNRPLAERWDNLSSFGKDIEQTLFPTPVQDFFKKNVNGVIDAIKGIDPNAGVSAEGRAVFYLAEPFTVPEAAMNRPLSL